MVGGAVRRLALVVGSASPAVHGAAGADVERRRVHRRAGQAWPGRLQGTLRRVPRRRAGGRCRTAACRRRFHPRLELAAALDLVNKIQNTMPANDPGKLTRPQTAAIVAYVLQAGKFPAGRSELGADDEQR